MTAREQLNAYIEQLEKRLRLGAAAARRGCCSVHGSRHHRRPRSDRQRPRLFESQRHRRALYLIHPRRLRHRLWPGSSPYALESHGAPRPRRSRPFPNSNSAWLRSPNATPRNAEPFLELLAADTLKIARKAEAGSSGAEQSTAGLARHRRGIARSSGLVDSRRAGLPRLRSRAALGRRRRGIASLRSSRDSRRRRGAAQCRSVGHRPAARHPA